MPDEDVKAKQPKPAKKFRTDEMRIDVYVPMFDEDDEWVRDEYFSVDSGQDLPANVLLQFRNAVRALAQHRGVIE
jgi:hypothetical protein